MNSIEAALAEHVYRLSVEIGPRPIGSAGNLAAAEYIREVFQAAGLVVEEQRFDCPDWQDLGTVLKMDGQHLAAAANAFSPSCQVTAPTVVVCSEAELAAANLEGRIGILCGELSKEPLLPKAFTIYQSERDQRIIQLLEEKRPAALLTVNLKPPSMQRIIEDWNFEGPSATVPAGVGLELVQHAGHPVELTIETSRKPSYSANVIGRKPAERKDRIVLCAHYDTKIDTPGAVDNAGGMAALLVLAQVLAGRELEAELELVAFSDEEYLGLCDQVYVQDKGGQMDQVLAVVNMDGVGQCLDANTVTMLVHSDAFRAQMDELVTGFPGVVWVDPWPQSNHSTFSMRGVPAVALSTAGAITLAHSPEDTVDWLCPHKLAEAVGMVSGTVELLHDKSLDWTREKN